MLPEHLTSILACPICKGGLAPFDGDRYLLCRPCGLKFPVRDGIPVLLADEAEAAAPPASREDTP